MKLNEVELLKIRVWELEQIQLERAADEHKASVAPLVRRIEHRMKLPAGAIGTTHMVDREMVVPKPVEHMDGDADVLDPPESAEGEAVVPIPAANVV